MLLIASSPLAAQGKGNCARSEARETLQDFLPAYNEGRSALLDGLFSRGERFRSYEFHPIERTGEDAGDRKTLIPYFRERHEMGDRLELEPNSLSVGRYDNGDRGFGFSLELDRTSDEVNPFASGHFVVKGSVDCDGIYFWNMTWESP